MPIAIPLQGLQLNKKSLGKYNIEELSKSLSNDTQALENVFTFLHYLWIGPIFTALAILILWTYIGISSLVGLGIILIIYLPFKGLKQFIISKYLNERVSKYENAVELLYTQYHGM